jgi:hypothetical protein
MAITLFHLGWRFTLSGGLTLKPAVGSNLTVVVQVALGFCCTEFQENIEVESYASQVVMVVLLTVSTGPCS